MATPFTISKIAKPFAKIKTNIKLEWVSSNGEHNNATKPLSGNAVVADNEFGEVLRNTPIRLATSSLKNNVNTLKGGISDKSFYVFKGAVSSRRVAKLASKIS